MSELSEKWLKAKRQAENIKRRKHKKAAIRKLLSFIKEALR